MGCGNGKYLHLRNALHPHPPTAATGGGAGDEEGQSNTNDCLTIGLDRSLELASFAQLQSLERMNGGGTSASASSSSSSPPPAAQWINEVTYGDGLSTCFRSHSFDYAISIATVHHFATRERRREAIREVVRVVRPIKEGERHKGRGRFLIYVWALEQRGQERRKWDEEEGEGEGEGERRRAAADGDGEGEKKAQGRDVMVPWVLKNGSGAKKGGGAEEPPLEGNVFQRCECRAITAPLLCGTRLTHSPPLSPDYHLFEATELEALVEEAANDMPGVVVRREDSGWERGNWWGIWQCVAREDAAAAAAAAAVTL